MVKINMPTRNALGKEIFRFFQSLSCKRKLVSKARGLTFLDMAKARNELAGKNKSSNDSSECRMFPALLYYPGRVVKSIAW